MVAPLFNVSSAPSRTKSSFHSIPPNSSDHFPSRIQICTKTITKFPKWPISRFMEHELAVAPVNPIIYTVEVFSSNGSSARQMLMTRNSDFSNRLLQINFLCWAEIAGGTWTQSGPVDVWCERGPRWSRGFGSWVSWPHGLMGNWKTSKTDLNWLQKKLCRFRLDSVRW